MADEETLTYPPVAVPGRLGGSRGPSGGEAGVIIDNRSDLPDHAVMEAVQDHFVGTEEFAGLQFGVPTSFQLYSTNQGSMLARTPFRVPNNVIDEIKLARALFDTDDDVASVGGMMIATAFGDGFQNHHQDEDTLGWFNEICKPENTGLETTLKEMYREYLIAASVTTLTLPKRARLSFYPTDGGDEKTAQLQIPSVGVIPAENIRVITNDVVGGGQLAFKAEEGRFKQWLDEFFGSRVSPARKAEMARQEPIMAAIFTGKVHVDWNDSDMFSAGQDLYTLNERMVHRTTMAKGASPYPRPLLTGNFALLEAKRLLNIMDYSLLQGGTNYIVVAKKGSDKQPAQQPEIDNLVDQVRTASRSGVLVGDHRLDIEIITPKLEELLSPAKRTLLGRKIAMRMLRLPEQVTGDAGQGGTQQELEYTSRVISSDRRDIKGHVESTVYSETARRNKATFPKGPPSLWFPRIILAGSKDFFTAVLQARDRGDIPRRWATETLGFDWDAGVAERKREIARGEDEIMAPAAVPFDGGDPNAPGGNGQPGGGPPDNQRGRPPGSSSNNGRGNDSPPIPSVRPRQLIQRTRGETIRAFMEGSDLVRVGELTQAILEEYPEREIGRVVAVERDAVEGDQMLQRGPVTVIPVNPCYEVSELRAIRLTDELSLIAGLRNGDNALIARALSFRDVDMPEEHAMRWGYVTGIQEHAEDQPPPEPEPRAASGEELAVQVATAVTTAMAELVKNLPTPTIVIDGGQGGATRKVIERDEHGAIIGVRDVPIEGE